MAGLETIPFTENHVEQAGHLLAARHGAHRHAEPLLAGRFEDPVAARAEVEALWQRAGASGAVAAADGRLTGFLLGTPREDEPWGPNVWVEPAGHAVEDAEVVRDLYGLAAARWVAEDRTFHYAGVPASDRALVDAWFRLGFGLQHVHALREAPARRAPARGHAIRRAARADIPALAELDLVLPEHQRQSPVFSRAEPLTLEQALADWEESIDDPAIGSFVAEHDGCLIGSAVGCTAELSRAHAGLARPNGAGLLAFAAVVPQARGQGVGRALGEAVLAWCAESGFRSVVTDWRAANLLSSRTWPRLGFRPTFLRLFRSV